jgi:NADPH-dependent ferric siderophore reductase
VTAHIYPSTTAPVYMEPLVWRVRHSPKFRMVTVARISDLTERIRRITFTGDELAGFVSSGFDDHVELFFPRSGEDQPARPATGGDGRNIRDDKNTPPARDFTPRRYDAAAGELDIEFVLHDEGLARRWAAKARPGSRLGIGGPRGSFVISTAFDWHVLIGEETALPAIGRRLEELPASAHAFVVAEVANVNEQLRFVSNATFDVKWVHRDGARPGWVDGLHRAARALRPPLGQGFTWIAAETAVAKHLRKSLMEKGFDNRRLRASGYWKQGAEATHDEHGD